CRKGGFNPALHVWVGTQTHNRIYTHTHTHTHTQTQTQTHTHTHGIATVSVLHVEKNTLGPRKHVMLKKGSNVNHCTLFLSFPSYQHTWTCIINHLKVELIKSVQLTL